MIYVGIAFSLAIISLIWGRYIFFNVRSTKNKYIAIFYDVIVTIQIGSTVYYLIFGNPRPIGVQLLAITSYLLASLLFYWSITTAKELDFAFSDRVGSLITNGPFKIVRHPFYTSYMVIWATNTIMFNSLLLWLSLLALIFFYYKSALKEENLILNSVHADEYNELRKNVGMFLPKVAQWKFCRFERSTKTMK